LSFKLLFYALRFEFYVSMIQAGTNLKIADNSGAKLIRVIKVLSGSRRRYARIGDIVTASVKEAEPRKAVKKKEIVKAVIVRQKKAFTVILDGMNPKGGRIFGPIPRELKDKGFTKIVSLAAEVL